MSKSKTQQAISWLMEESTEKRTLEDAAIRFGLKSPDGIGLALKLRKTRDLSKELDSMIAVSNMPNSFKLKWADLFEILN